MCKASEAVRDAITAAGFCRTLPEAWGALADDGHRLPAAVARLSGVQCVCDRVATEWHEQCDIVRARGG